jgi:hypothetical protein
MSKLTIVSRISLLCMLLLGPLHAWAEARIEIQSNAAVLYIQGEIEARADRETAWAVLTDYNHWSEYIPDLLVSRVISRPGAPLYLEQRGRIPSMPNFPLVMILAVQETPGKQLRFFRTAGNVRSFSGEWQIEGKRRRVRLLYRAAVEPGFPMPPQVSMEIFRNETKGRLEALAREMERRMPANSR